ncbi:MAG: hypothetical protein JWQ07_3879 [Ramlibacter sp.]|nr:hypothetical protein [Ramlibacter sp.]
MKFFPRTLLLCTMAAAASVATAGTVDVSFVNAAGFSDAGNTTADEQANLKALATHLQALGQRLLPASQLLKVEVLDVDLAGTVRTSARNGSALRTVRGNADFPRMHLRYTLEADGKTLRNGDERLSDLNYARGIPKSRDSESLYYEKRMLDAWFKERFAAAG